jgi:hypothetical protein
MTDSKDYCNGIGAGMLTCAIFAFVGFSGFAIGGAIGLSI